MNYSKKHPMNHKDRPKEVREQHTLAKDKARVNKKIYSLMHANIIPIWDMKKGDYKYAALNEFGVSKSATNVSITRYVLLSLIHI